MDGIPVGSPTGYLLYRSLERYRYTIPLDFSKWGDIQQRFINYQIQSSFGVVCVTEVRL
jgi:hypothetical protein